MRNIYSILLATVGVALLSCSSANEKKKDHKSDQEKYEEEKEDPDRPDYPKDFNINPETRQITFPSKENTVIVKTQNPFWFIYGNEPFYAEQAQNKKITYQPINFDRDTLVSPWIKVIALDNKKNLASDGKHMYIESKTLKIIAHKNETIENRKFIITLTYGNYGDYISVTQEGK